MNVEIVELLYILFLCVNFFDIIVLYCIYRIIYSKKKNYKDFNYFM